MKISACYIVKNEEQNIARSVKSIAGNYDELIVVDTGSSDKTVEVSKSLGAKCFAIEWKNDFASARNYAISKAVGDWIIFLDADEYYIGDVSIRAYLKNIEEHHSNVEALYIPLYDMHKMCLPPIRVIRIFRRREDLFYEGVIHEVVTKKEGEFDIMQTDTLKFVHTGYHSLLMPEKLKRNLSIMLNDIAVNGDREHYYYYIAECYFGLQDYEKALEYIKKALSAKVRHIGEEANYYHIYIESMRQCEYPAEIMEEVAWRAIRKFPKMPEFYGEQGMILSSLGRLKEALQLLIKCVELYRSPERMGQISGYMDEKSLAIVNKRIKDISDIIKNNEVNDRRGKMLYSCYVNNVDIIKHRLPRKVVLYGKKSEIIDFLRLYAGYFHIVYCISDEVPLNEKDNINGVEVVNSSYALKKGVDEIIIVIHQNVQEIVDKYFSRFHLEAIKDYVIWVWDLQNVHLSYITEFIEWNKRVWKRNDNCNENKVLVTMFGGHCGIAVFNSYYANVVARRENADIVGCLIKAEKNVFLEKEVYKSFNTTEFLCMRLSEKQKKIVGDLFNYIYPQIHSKYDLINLCIDDINYGFEIYRYFVRVISASFDARKYENELKSLLYGALRVIVYYSDYFKKNNVKAIFLTDGLYFEGLVRMLAWKYKAKVYAIDEGRLLDWSDSECFGTEAHKENYKKIFERLTESQKIKAIEWGRVHLEKRLEGDVSDIKYMRGKNAFVDVSSKRFLSNDKKIKVVICPHCISDDPYPFGKFLFNDHEEWLCYLGELSNMTDYDWYIKYHPSAGLESTALWDDILKKYPRIKKLPMNISPIQLKKEGVNFALTLWGTIGHEYPALGIQVINGARNYHEDFDFDWNPKTVEEYQELLLNLKNLDKKIDKEEIYQFYYVHYKYIAEKMNKDIFYPKRQVYTSDYPTPLALTIDGTLYGFHEQYGEWLYRWFMDECTQDYHEKLVDIIEKKLGFI